MRSASQTAEIYMDDGDSVVPTVVFVGDGVLNAVKNQQAMKLYGVTSTESHIKNCLLIDMPIWVCKEDMERLGLKRTRWSPMPMKWAPSSGRSSFHSRTSRKRWSRLSTCCSSSGH